MEEISIFNKKDFSDQVKDNNNISTISTPFIDNIRVFKPTANLKTILPLYHPNFKSSVVGIDILNNLSKVIFFNINYIKYLNFFAYYDYTTEMFKLHKRSYIDGDIDLYDLYFSLDILPVIIDTPITLLDIVSEGGETPTTKLCLPYEMWALALIHSKKYESLYHKICRKYIVNQAWNSPNLNLCIYSINGKTLLLDKFDTMYFNTLAKEYDNDIEKCLYNTKDPKLVHLADKDVIPYMVDIFPSIRYNAFESTILSFSEPVSFIASAINCTTLNGRVCIDRLYYDSSSQKFTEDGGIEFRVGKKYLSIFMYSDYIKIGKKKYIIDIDMLNLFLTQSCKEYAKKNWTRYIIKEDNEMKDYDALCEAKEEKEKDAIEKDIAVCIDREVTNSLVSEEDEKAIEEITKYDSETYTRICIIRHFDEYFKTHNDYIGFKSVKEQLEEYIDKVGDASIDTYIRLCRANILTDIMPGDFNYRMMVAFMEWCGTTYGTILFNDFKLYSSKHISIKNINEISDIAMSIMKSIDYRKEKLDSMIKKFDKISNVHCIYKQYAYITDLYYENTVYEANNGYEYAVFIASIPDRPYTYVLFLAHLEKLLDAIELGNIFISEDNKETIVCPGMSTEFNLVENDPEEVYSAVCKMIFSHFVNKFNEKIRVRTDIA